MHLSFLSLYGTLSRIYQGGYVERLDKSLLEPYLWEGNFSEEQFDLLHSCAEEGSMKAWALYRRKNRKEPILLEGANLDDLNLSKADLKGAKLKGASLCRTTLQNTVFMKADLQQTRFDGATMEKCDFLTADLRNARFTSVVGSQLHFRFADLTGADFHEALCTDSDFDRATLCKTTFHSADLTGARFNHSDLKGTIITETRLDATHFNAAIVDGQTLIWDCHFDRETNFAGVGLADARIEPQLFSRFQTNIRRIWWRRTLAKQRAKATAIRKKISWKQPHRAPILLWHWIKNRITTEVTQLFWWTTDYGASTTRLLKSVLLVSGFFALLYAFVPGATNENFADLPFLLRCTRSLYFSIVTTTTVGFGDISANPTSLISHLILISHLLTGYTLLGALIVRLGILFQALPDAEIQQEEAKNV